MARRINKKDILKKIDCIYLDLVKVKPRTYKERGVWIFVYQHDEKRIFRTHVIYKSSLADMSKEKWIYEGKTFAESIKNG